MGIEEKKFIEIEEYIRSSSYGRVEDLSKYILGMADITLREAERIANRILEDMWFKGEVRLPYKEQKRGAYIFETVG